jgi:hypothetical protein
MNLLLSWCGIDARRYWLLMDLFQQLSSRGEMLDQMGLNGFALKQAALLYFVMTAFLCLIFVVTQPAVTVYFAVFMAITAVLLLGILLSEAGNSLFNPAEAMVLAHQPINGATYTAAKLSHLVRIVLYLVPGINAVPALAGLLLKGSTWYYPIFHLAAAFAVGLAAALLCCALFGWMLRVIPMRRLKAASQLAGSLPFLGVMSMGPAGNLIRRLHLHVRVADQLARPAVRWGLGIAIGAGVIFGIRSLTADYLIRVSSLTRGGASAGSRARKSKLGGGLSFLVRRFLGGQPAVAGFAFVSRMMLRDFQFRRQMIPMAVFPLISLGSAFSAGWPPDPFSGRFTPLHLLPHLLGMLLLFICMFLRYGNDYKGVWIFLSIPSRAFDGFAHGVFAVLWITVILIPHLIVFPVLAWLWGIPHALPFITFSITAASVYLGLELRMIENIPFSTQIDPSRQSVGLTLMLGGGIVASIAVGVQYWLVFRSPAGVAVSAAALGVAAYFATRASLSTLAVSMRYNLGLVSQEAGKLYKEIAV